MILAILWVIMVLFINIQSEVSDFQIIEEDAVDWSIKLLEAARYQHDAAPIYKKLANISLDVLDQQLSNDDLKKTFWINIYNAVVQLELTQNASLFDNRGRFFSTERVTIAGKELSLDDIEHGIIRGSRSKLTLGLTKKLMVPDYERKLRTKKRDGRIHFALNCGAKSCPPVATYHPDRIEEQLKESTQKFLMESSTYLKDENKVQVTTLFSWFRGDFGGLQGVVKNYLIPYHIIPEGSDPKLEFAKYDWTLSLGNYIDL